MKGNLTFLTFLKELLILITFFFLSSAITLVFVSLAFAKPNSFFGTHIQEFSDLLFKGMLPFLIVLYPLYLATKKYKTSIVFLFSLCIYPLLTLTPVLYLATSKIALRLFSVYIAPIPRDPTGAIFVLPVQIFTLILVICVQIVALGYAFLEEKAQGTFPEKN